MTVARLGYEIDSSGAVKAAGDLDDMSAAAKRAEVAAGGVAGGAGKAGKALGGVTFNARMLVPQLSQIGQQFTATGQLGQAVAVQAADIGLAFGVVGTVIGTVAGVALPSLLDAFFDAEGGVLDFDDALSKSQGTLEEYISLVKSAELASNDYLDAAIRSVEFTSQASKDLLEIARIEAFKGIEALNESLVESVLSASLLKTAMADAGDLLNIETTLRGNITVWKENRAEVGSFVEQLEALNTASSLDEMYAAAIALRDTFKATVDVTGKMTTEQIAFWKSISQSIQQMEMLGAAQSAVIADASDWAGAMAGVRMEIDAIGASLGSIGGGVMDNAAKAVELQALRAGKSIREAAVEGVRLRKETEFAARESGANFFERMLIQGERYQFERGLQLDAELDQERAAAREREKAASGGRGVGGASDAELTRLMQSLQTEREVLDIWYFEQQMALQMASDQELAIIGGKNEAKLRLEQEYQERLVAIKQQEAQHIISAQSAMYGELSSLLGMFGQKSKAAAAAAIAINTVLRVRETLQNTAAASVRALAELGPIAGPPAAAKIAAYGKAQAALIAAGGAIQAVGKLGGSGSGSSAGITATGAQQTQQTRAIISLKGGRSRFTVEELDDIVQQIQDKSDDGVIIEGFSRA